MTMPNIPGLPNIPGAGALAGIPGAGAAAGAAVNAAQAATGAVQAQVTQVANQVTNAAQGAIGAGAGAATSALTGMGVPPDVANSVVGPLSDEAMKGFHSVLRAIAHFPGHIFGGLFHHHHHVHAIPQMQAVVASLPPAQQVGAVQALNVVNATMQGQTAASVAPAGATPAQAAQALVTAGAPPSGTPGAPEHHAHLIPVGVGLAVGIGGALLATMKIVAIATRLPIVLGAGAVGALIGHFVGQHRPAAPAVAAHGDSPAASAGDDLMQYMRLYGVPPYATQVVALFASAWNAENPGQPLPIDGRYTPAVQMALAMTRSGGSTTVPNPLLK
jgi:hypothetical protein